MSESRISFTSHVVSGALGAVFAVGLVACLGMRPAREPAGHGEVTVTDAAGHVRISLGEDPAQSGSYGLQLFTPDGKEKSLSLVATNRGNEMILYDKAGKLKMWLMSDEQETSIDLFDAGNQDVHLGSKSAKGHLALYDVTPTSFDGQSGFAMHRTVSLPE